MDAKSVAVGESAPGARRPGRPRHLTPSSGYIKRRNEIIEVAAGVFEAKGYGAGSLDDVAVELNLRKASLYYYVRSKAELLYLIFDRAISTALDRLEQPRHALMDPKERLSHLLVHQIHQIAANTSLFAVFFDQRPHLDDAYEREIETKERRYLRIFIDAIDDAIEAGVFEPMDSRYGAQLLLGMANWTYKWFDPVRDDAEELAATAIALLLGTR